jgi:hypothetical protein
MTNPLLIGKAKYGTFQEFLDLYKPGDAKQLVNGRSLLLEALSNTKPEERYAIANFLLDQGADASFVDPDFGYGTEMLLIAAKRQDLPKTAALLGRLIASGANPNTVSRGGTRPIFGLLNLSGSEDDLEPVYDVFFSQPNIDVDSPRANGDDPISAARKSGPGWDGFIARVEAYKAAHQQ